MQRVFLAAVLAAFFATATSAQTIVVKPAERPSMPAQVRVSIAVNMFVTADENSDQSLKAQE